MKTVSNYDLTSNLRKEKEWKKSDMEWKIKGAVKWNKRGIAWLYQIVEERCRIEQIQTTSG